MRYNFWYAVLSAIIVFAAIANAAAKKEKEGDHHHKKHKHGFGLMCKGEKIDIDEEMKAKKNETEALINKCVDAWKTRHVDEVKKIEKKMEEWKKKMEQFKEKMKKKKEEKEKAKKDDDDDDGDDDGKKKGHWGMGWSGFGGGHGNKSNFAFQMAAMGNQTDGEFCECKLAASGRVVKGQLDTNIMKNFIKKLPSAVQKDYTKDTEECEKGKGIDNGKFSDADKKEAYKKFVQCESTTFMKHCGMKRGGRGKKDEKA